MIYIRAAVSGEENILLLPQTSVLKIQSRRSLKSKKEAELGETVLYKLFCAAGIDPDLDGISVGIHGKPFLRDRKDVAYNISHSEDVATGILMTEADGYEVGCDVEMVNRNTSEERYLKIAKRFFTENERLKISEAADGLLEFYRIWSRKEAYIKYTGEGLSRPLASFDVCCGNEIDGTVLHTDIICDRLGREYAFSVCVPKEKFIFPIDTDGVKDICPKPIN